MAGRILDAGAYAGESLETLQRSLHETQTALHTLFAEHGLSREAGDALYDTPRMLFATPREQWPLPPDTYAADDYLARVQALREAEDTAGLYAISKARVVDSVTLRNCLYGLCTARAALRLAVLEATAQRLSGHNT